MSYIERKPRNLSRNIWTGIQTPTTEQRHFFNRFDNISEGLPHDQYLIPAFDQKTLKTNAKIMPMKANQKTWSFSTKIKDIFVKNFELLDILLTIMEEDKDADEEEDEDEKNHEQEEEEIPQEVSRKCYRAYQKVLNLLPLYPNETNTEFLIAIDSIVAGCSGNELLSLDKLLQEAMKACERPLQLYFQGNKKKRLHGLRVLSDHRIEVMTDFPGDRLCCGDKHGNIYILDPKVIFQESKSQATTATTTTTAGITRIPVEMIDDEPVTHIITKAGIPNTEDYYNRDYLPYCFTAHGHILKIWKDLEKNECLHTISISIPNERRVAWDNSPMIRSVYVFEEGQSVCTLLRNGLTKVWDTLSGELLYETNLTIVEVVLHTVLPTMSFENDDVCDMDALIYTSDKKIQVWQPVLRKLSASTRQEGQQSGSEIEPENVNENESESVVCPGQCQSQSEDIFEIEDDPEVAYSVRCMYRMDDHIYFGTFAGEIFQRSVSNLYENRDVGEIAPLQSGETNATPISVLHHARSLGLLVGNASGQFIYEDGEEETSLYLPHRHLTIALEDCLRHIFPLAHERDWLCTTGYTVNSHSYYGRDKVFHPCLIWNMSPILRYPGLARSKVCCRAQHVLLGHYEEDEHYDSCLQTMSSLTSGVLAGLNRAGRVLLWDLQDNVKTATAANGDGDGEEEDSDEDSEEDDEEDDQD